MRPGLSNPAQSAPLPGKDKATRPND
jgi:hypothetical protein